MVTDVHDYVRHVMHDGVGKRLQVIKWHASADLSVRYDKVALRFRHLSLSSELVSGPVQCLSFLRYSQSRPHRSCLSHGYSTPARLSSVQAEPAERVRRAQPFAEN